MCKEPFGSTVNLYGQFRFMMKKTEGKLYLDRSKSLIFKSLSHCMVGSGSPSTTQSIVRDSPALAVIGVFRGTTKRGATEKQQ